MPHKRANRSVREQQRKERGADLAPLGHQGRNRGLADESIPKSVLRVLDAAKIRAEYRQKRKLPEAKANDDDDDDGPTSKKRRRTTRRLRRGLKGKGSRGETMAIKIQPGESLRAFNRRVEDHMRPLVRSAIRASAATERAERKAIVTDPASSSAKSHRHTSTTTRKPNSSSKHDNSDRPKEFAITSSAAPRRLNDVAMAPPELKRVPRPRGVASSGKKPRAMESKAGGVLSMAQRAMLEAERENAIRRYREMKEAHNQHQILSLGEWN
ncbi:hypothetical protein BGW80DRAFT_1288485 [Lactifluus volemus]|nr:hypothetical protein BGW80DRAFT_1288485 [Lactifluus volemus]